MPRAKASAPKPNGHASTSEPASTPAPAAGHNNGPLTDEEASALVTHHALKIIADQRKVDAAKVELDSAKAVVNGHYKMIAKDLGFTRKEFEAEVVEKLNMTEAEYLSAENKRDRLHRLAGLKPGEQLDLIEHVLADTIDDGIAAEANGYRAGRRADDPFPPKEIHGSLQTDWMRGYHEGQAYNGRQLEIAAKVLARPAPGTMVAAPDEPDAEADDGSPEALKARAQALKDSGWTEPTSAETELADA